MAETVRKGTGKEKKLTLLKEEIMSDSQHSTLKSSHHLDSEWGWKRQREERESDKGREGGGKTTAVSSARAPASFFLLLLLLRSARRCRTHGLPPRRPEWRGTGQRSALSPVDVVEFQSLVVFPHPTQSTLSLLSWHIEVKRYVMTVQHWIKKKKKKRKYICDKCHGLNLIWSESLDWVTGFEASLSTESQVLKRVSRLSHRF